MQEKWVCAKCGRRFSRKWSGERHLVNIENGASSLITNVQYELGIRTGVFAPPLTRPNFAKKQETDIITLLRQKLKEKFVDYVAEKAMQDPDSRMLVGAMFMNELVGGEVKPDYTDKLFKLLSKMCSQFQTR